ncbi:hypothetical protein NDU88_004185 [Pleurodeles waltl]|uniref:DUF4629 domain-containing protein n=1 Tax=Pleurodeles waltl TaxID=8319 RepID=A0AAV7NIR9_PLEWA|nr:hypothetical protein NDU88_004185 [Pleurodeles waltl]
MSALTESLPQSEFGRPNIRHTIATETVHTTVDRSKNVTEVTYSEIISSSLDSREEKTVLAQSVRKLTHPMQRAEKVESPGKISQKHIHLSEVHETKTLDLNDTTKEKQDIRGMSMVNDTLYTSASEDLQLKQSHDKDSMEEEVATFPLGKIMSAPKPVKNADTTNVSRTGALRSDSGADVSKATKRKKSEIKEQPTKRAKSQTIVLNKEESLQKYKCVCPESENKSTTVNPENKLKVNEKTTKTQGKRKEVCTETEQVSFKRHRSSLSLQMLESIQVFHPLGKKGQSTGAARASGNPAAPLSTEGHSSSTGRLIAKVHEKPLVSAQRDDKISEKSKISTQTVLPVTREIVVDKHSVHLDSTNNTRSGVRIMPGKEMRKGDENRVSTMNMTNSKCLGDKQILSEDRARSLAVNGQRCPKVGSKMGNESSKAIRLPSKQLPSATLKVPIEPALKPPAARPAAPIDHATAFCGKDQRPERLPLSHLSHLPCPTKELEESIPISEEQRPEREAMKRRAQLERENACLYTSLGKLQFFVQRIKDHQYAKDFGYPDILLQLSKSYLLPD